MNIRKNDFNSSGCEVLIAGGGTAGHVIPAIAIGDSLCREKIVDSRAKIQVVGSKRGVGEKLFIAAGYELTLLPGRGLQRKLAFKNFIAIFELFNAFFRSLFLLKKIRPKVIVATGGYASFACGLAAVLLRIPLVVTEQNIVPGSVNKFLSRFSVFTAVSFEATQLRNQIFTGNPLRVDVLDFIVKDKRETARATLKVGERKMLTVFGGSLGARRINELMIDIAKEWNGSPLLIHHVVGSRDWPKISKVIPIFPSDVEYKMVEFENDMATVLGSSDLVVCRSGATSIAEITALGIPSVLLPLPGSPGNHQVENARFLSEAGAASLIEEKELSVDRLRGEIIKILEERNLLMSMSTSSRSLARLDAGKLIAELIGDKILREDHE
tara:strand:- start:107 stop:1255 length:1149 start_codon:yes stop_codon:yes gene_type:complete